ncbi:universal stress protein [Hyphomicrobium sp.]|uniref:universal stress protein n=1 Tax=Hyphomicrobium sp. TaxID=82 RepID=UPI002FE1850B
MLHELIGHRLFSKGQRDRAASMHHIMVASEGRSFSDETLKMAAALLPAEGGRILVLTVARLWGTSWGLPHRGLRPTPREMDEQRSNLDSAIARLEKMGIETRGHIVTTRQPARSIRKIVDESGCDAVVMGADPRRSALVSSLMWSQEPYRVQRALRVPVYLSCPDTKALPTPKPDRKRSARKKPIGRAAPTGS